LKVDRVVVISVAVYMVDIKLATVDRNKSTHFASRFLVLAIDIFWSWDSSCFIPQRLLTVVRAEFLLLAYQRI
jgi:hypothetical protein